MPKRSHTAGNKEILDVLSPNRTDRLDRILSVVSVGIGMVVDRVILEVNPYLCKMLGYEPGELLGRNARMLYPDNQEYKRVGDIKYQEISLSGKGSIDTRWKRKDGKIIDVQLRSVPLNVSDLSEGVIFTAIDITEKKNAEWRRTRHCLK